MKAYLSYSLNDEQKYVITVLAKVLLEKGYTLTTGNGAHLRILGNSFRHSISGSSLFIGVVTQTGLEAQRVYDEYIAATSMMVPSLLLIDEEVAMRSSIFPSPNILMFNHYDPISAIETVRARVKQARIGSEATDDSTAWVIGGMAVLTLIALLSGKK